MTMMGICYRNNWWFIWNGMLKTPENNESIYRYRISPWATSRSFIAKCWTTEVTELHRESESMDFRENVFLIMLSAEYSGIGTY